MCIRDRTKAVGAYDHSVLEQDVVAEVAELSNDGVSMGEEIIADGGSAIDDHMGEENGFVSDDSVFVDHYVGPEVCVLAQLRRGVNDCRRMDSGGIARWLVKQFDGLGPGKVWVLAAQHAGVDGREIL